MPVEQEPRHHLVIENEFVRALAVEIAPHERTLCHHHAHDYLLYVAGDADIVSAARDEEPKRLSYRDGECELLPAGMVHVVENLGDTVFRNVVVELLPKSVGLRRGAGPQPKGSSEGWIDARGKIVRIRQIFDDSKAASIYRLSMQSLAEVEISGPAVIASPYGGRLDLEELGEPACQLNKFRDLKWLRPNAKGILRNGAKGAAKVVIFQLGSSAETASAV